MTHAVDGVHDGLDRRLTKLAVLESEEPATGIEVSEAEYACIRLVVIDDLADV